MAVFARNFSHDFDLTWGSDRVRILNNGELLTLSLDKDSGSAFQSNNEYLFGKISVQLKLVPGYSAGTVTSYYLTSQGSTWDEMDFEFLGNLSGDPYTVHTNVITEVKETQSNNSASGLTQQQTSTPIPSSGIPMSSYDWATKGGLIKTDWSKAPFTASFRNISAQACIWAYGSGAYPCNSNSWLAKQLDAPSLERLMWVQSIT
ncbi:hypothetical protein PVK06_026995 [Gossypium arboreum]|uniref:GH16 domain-containing protein n=1 Tax=Gossypium arboreum TaxID=29729 RepID=A0ABR0NZM3_GOSAR|nr:hypothetical protein PVK06_026995 [Gossypium arboreum]